MAQVAANLVGVSHFDVKVYIFDMCEVLVAIDAGKLKSSSLKGKTSTGKCLC